MAKRTSTPTLHDTRDGDALLHTLRDEVIPLYYDRDRDGLPRAWIARMKRAIRTLGWRFSADRMVMDYVLNVVHPRRRRHERGDAINAGRWALGSGPVGSGTSRATKTRSHEDLFGFSTSCLRAFVTLERAYLRSGSSNT